MLLTEIIDIKIYGKMEERRAKSEEQRAKSEEQRIPLTFNIHHLGILITRPNGVLFS